jgi:hypothetical protein
MNRLSVLLSLSRSAWIRLGFAGQIAQPQTKKGIEYPYATAEPQKTGWPRCVFADDSVMQSVPQSVKARWADFDPRKHPLKTEILREWTEDEGGVFRHTVASGSDRLGTRATRASIKSGDASASGGNIESILGGGHPSFGQKRLDGVSISLLEFLRLDRLSENLGDASQIVDTIAKITMSHSKPAFT